MKLQPTSVLGGTFKAAAEVPGFAAPATELRERSDIGCVLVNSAVPVSVVAGVLAAAIGVIFPDGAGPVAGVAGSCAIWLTPRAWLVQCPIDEEQALIARVNDVFTDRRVHATALTDALCWLELSGVPACDALRAGSFVSLERDGLAVGHAKRTLLSGVAVLLLRSHSQTWLIGVERGRARYVAAWLQDAARGYTAAT
jgi:heterotetrameric sarcosine oxidase gamma subunit